MPSTSCYCGAVLEGATRDEQVRNACDHMATAHPDLELATTQVRNYVERQDQLAPPGEPVADLAEGDVEIVEVGEAVLDDVLTFFDQHAFADNPPWASCYCQAHHVAGGEGGEAWSARTWQSNREDLAEGIRAGTTKGCIAYAGGRVVGWCNGSPRSSYPDYACGAGDDRVGVTACFVIDPAYRGHGIATRLLDRACEQFTRDGMEAVEGHPVADPQSAASSYRGPVPMYLKAGFEVEPDPKSDDGGDPGRRTIIVRRALNGPIR